MAEQLPAWTADWWRPIETAPKDGQPLLLWWRTCRAAIRGRYHCDEDGEGWRNDGDQMIPKNQKDCVRWMPLPPPPAINA